MNLKSKQMTDPSWDDIFYNTLNNFSVKKRLEHNLRRIFSKEYVRIKSVYKPIDYYEDNTVFINSFVNTIPEKLKILNVKLISKEERIHVLLPMRKWIC